MTVQFAGRVTADDMQAHIVKIESLAGKLERGFTLLTDLSTLEAMDSECTPLLSRTMDLISSYGVGRIIRIIPDPEKDIGFNLLSVFHYPAGTPIVTCENLAEATVFLD